MHFTRRRPDRRRASALVALASSLVAGVMGSLASSCSSNDDGEKTVTDAAPETSESLDSASGDAGIDVRQRDAGSFDGGPLPVVCASSPCARSLVTTLGANELDRGEGFCARLDDGTVACWGAGAAGQLGRGEEASAVDSATAARVVGLSDIVKLDHTCALDKNGATYCWGTGPYLGSDASATTTERSPVRLPIPPATNVSAGHVTACATVESGVLCWGRNTSGQLALIDSTSYSAVFPPQAIAVPSGAPVKQLVVGRASFVLREDGTTVSWGANPPLGRVSPLFPDPYPQLVELGGIANMDVGHDNACAVANGIGYCWGAAVPDNFDPPSKTDRALPEAIVTPEPLVQIATTRMLVDTNFGTRVVQPQRWCACAASGAVYCGGYNASGQAGDGTKDFVFDAVRVVGLPDRAAEVRTTPDATCALLTTGKVYCWGSDFYGQLGNQRIKQASLVPQEVVMP